MTQPLTNWHETLKELIRKRRADEIRSIIHINKTIIAGNFRWLDKLLSGPSQVIRGLREELWEVVRRSRRNDPRALQVLLECAQDARNLPWQSRIAKELERLVETDLHTEPALRWSALGEAKLLENDLAGAAQCFNSAARFMPDHPRVLAGRLVIALDRSEFAAAHELAYRLATRLNHDALPQAAEFISRSADLWLEQPVGLLSVEVVVFCHVTAKLVKNSHLAPPSIGLVEASATSFRERLRLDPGTKITVFFDSRESDMDFEFLRNLTQWSEANGVGVVANVRHGLRRQWIDAFARATADVVAVIEQDHLFLENCPNISEVLSVFERRPDIKYIRLNRRSNTMTGVDRLLITTPADQQDGLCRTARFSNTPHLQRRRFFETVIYPIIVDRPDEDERNGGAAGVEEKINRLLPLVESVIGVSATTRLLGNGLWGGIGVEARVENLGI